MSERVNLKLEKWTIINDTCTKRIFSKIDNAYWMSFQSVMLVAVQCMCDLLTSLPHFNFHTNLVAVLVPRMNDKFLDGQVRQRTVSGRFTHRRFSNVPFANVLSRFSLAKRSESYTYIYLVFSAITQKRPIHMCCCTHCRWSGERSWRTDLAW